MTSLEAYSTFIESFQATGKPLKLRELLSAQGQFGGHLGCLRKGRKNPTYRSRIQPGSPGGQGGHCPLVLLSDRTGDEDANDWLRMEAGAGPSLQPIGPLANSREAFERGREER